MSSSVRTLLFSDIEGSTGLLERAGEQYPRLLLRHREIVREAIRATGGTEHGTEGDSFFVSFDSPSSALAAAVQVQQELEACEWPDGLRLRVRIGLHLGEVEDLDGGLVGMALHHAARIAAAAHGGQIIVSESVQSMARVLPAQTSLRMLGQHRLRDVGVVRLFQVEHPELQKSFPELRGVIGNRTNLPRIATVFVGGEQLLTSIGDLVDRARIVTLTGTGGVGKTRAAVEFGWRRLDDFADGVFFVDLAPISDAGAVPAAVAATIPTIATGGAPLLDSVVDWLANRRLMLVVDNCEHVLDEVSDLVNAVIARCEHVRVLATSREPLGAVGERVWRVPSLDTEGDAVDLFCDRAAASDSSFERDGHEAVLAEVCQRLDGIPLAIELAAARIRSLSPEELLVRLQDRFRLLRGSGRGTLDRHLTLRSTVSWSYQLLTDAERLLFDRLSVFAGGFDLRAAEVVCGTDPLDDADVLDLVGSLVDKSMLLALHTAGGTRFRLQETLRQFGEEQLELRGETTSLRQRHMAHYTEQGQEFDRLFRSVRQIEGTAKFNIEWDNMRAAHEWALASADLDAATRLIKSSYYYAIGQMRHEHGEWTHRTIELGEAEDRPSSYTFAMQVEWLNLQGRDVEVLRAVQRGIDVAPAPDDPSTAGCWHIRAMELLSSTSTGARDALRHMEAAVANVEDLDTDWFAIVDLVDCAANIDPVASKKYLRQLSEIAARVQAPLLVTNAYLYEGHALLVWQSTPDYGSAMGFYTRAVDVARAASDVNTEAMALRAVALAATGLERDDALDRCREALWALYESRHWQKIWQVLDSAVLALTRAGRAEEAALILGHLQVHMPAYGLEDELGFRATASEMIHAAGNFSAMFARGAQLSADEIVGAALVSCGSPSTV